MQPKGAAAQYHALHAAALRLSAGSASSVSAVLAANQAAALNRRIIPNLFFLFFCKNREGAARTFVPLPPPRSAHMIRFRFRKRFGTDTQMAQARRRIQPVPGSMRKGSRAQPAAAPSRCSLPAPLPLRALFPPGGCAG